MPKECFQIFSAKILADCYEKFPVALDFTKEDFFKLDSSSTAEDIFFTFKALKNFGYITYKSNTIGFEYFHYVELTKDGYNMLTEKNGKNTIGKAIVKAIKEGSKESIFEVLRLIVQSGWKWYTF